MGFTRMRQMCRQCGFHSPRAAWLLLVVAPLLLVSCGSPPAPAVSRGTAPAAQASRVMTFTTEGAGFAPVLVVEGTPDILWTWSDGSTSISATPRKDFGTDGTRTHSLLVQPWGAVRRINLGYDAGDDGVDDYERVPDQQVSAVTGLALVAPSLEQWCSSYNRLQSLDFSNFAHLDTIESYHSPTLTGVTLANTPKLRRACFEHCRLRSLDLSQCPALGDLRGAENSYPSVTFGGIGRRVWHICVRDNPQFTNPALFKDMRSFPNISELFIWDDNQAGSLRLPASNPNRRVELLADTNHYTSVDLSGSLRNGTLAATVSFRDNQLTSFDISGCVQITQLMLERNRLSGNVVDRLLATLDSLGRSRTNSSAGVPLLVDLRSNSIPGPDGRAAALRLAAKGWAVLVDGVVVQPPPRGLVPEYVLLVLLASVLTGLIARRRRRG
jgi:hypothetical protein